MNINMNINTTDLMCTEFQDLCSLPSVNTDLSYAVYMLAGFFSLILGFVLLGLVMYMNANTNLFQRILRHDYLHDNQNNREKPIIDIRWSELKKKTIVFEETQKTPWEIPISYIFLYDNADRSGENILGFAKSRAARRITVYMNGLPVTGYQLRGLRVGIDYRSRLLDLDPIWLTNKSITHRLVTIGLPIITQNDKHCILSSRDKVKSIETNKDIRNRIDYITS